VPCVYTIYTVTQVLCVNTFYTSKLNLN
jgi:hypothetical protein